MTEDWWAADESHPLGSGAEDSGWEDPIVAEVHAIRARLWESAGGTIDGLYALLKASETARGAAMAATPTPVGDGKRSEPGRGR
jgi:hypothetical protein